MTISIITAVFNAGSTIQSCIDSVLAQEGVTVEHVVVDGGSTDATLEVVQSYGDRIARLLPGPDRGIYDAMNKGLAVVTGDIVGLLNADDFYASKQVLRKVKAAFDDPTVDACYGDLVYVSGADVNRVVRYWRSGAFQPEKFYRGWMPPHPTFYVRRSVYEKFGVFNLALGSAADYEIMLRFLLKHRIKVAYIPEVLVHMRTGGASNANVGNRLRANRMDRKAWEENGLKPYPWTLLAKPIRKIPQWFVRP